MTFWRSTIHISKSGHVQCDPQFALRRLTSCGIFNERGVRPNSRILRSPPDSGISATGQTQPPRVSGFLGSRYISTAHPWPQDRPPQNASKPLSVVWMGRRSATNASRTGSISHQLRRRGLRCRSLAAFAASNCWKHPSACAASRDTSFATRVERRAVAAAGSSASRLSVLWRRQAAPEVARCSGRAAHLARYPCLAVAGPQARAHAARLRAHQERLFCWRFAPRVGGSVALDV